MGEAQFMVVGTIPRSEVPSQFHSILKGDVVHGEVRDAYGRVMAKVISKEDGILTVTRAAEQRVFTAHEAARIRKEILCSNLQDTFSGLYPCTSCEEPSVRHATLVLGDVSVRHICSKAAARRHMRRAEECQKIHSRYAPALARAIESSDLPETLEVLHKVDGKQFLVDSNGERMGPLESREHALLELVALEREHRVTDAAALRRDIEGVDLPSTSSFLKIGHTDDGVQTVTVVNAIQEEAPEVLTADAVRVILEGEHRRGRISTEQKDTLLSQVQTLGLPFTKARFELCSDGACNQEQHGHMYDTNGCRDDRPCFSVFQGLLLMQEEYHAELFPESILAEFEREVRTSGLPETHVLDQACATIIRLGNMVTEMDEKFV